MTCAQTVEPFRWTIHDTLIHLRQELCSKPYFYYGLSEGEKSTVQNQVRIVRPLKTKKTPKVSGSVKFIFSVLADRSLLLYLISDDAFNALIDVDIEREIGFNLFL
jgi:hypothetical protein